MGDLVGKRHPYYLAPWMQGKKQVTGIWAHECQDPKRPIVVYENSVDALSMVTQLNKATVNKESPAP